jgi:hypothetical protein
MNTAKGNVRAPMIPRIAKGIVQAQRCQKQPNFQKASRVTGKKPRHGRSKDPFTAAHTVAQDRHGRIHGNLSSLVNGQFGNRR